LFLPVFYFVCFREIFYQPFYLCIHIRLIVREVHFSGIAMVE
jgi:hypothetical protein